MPPLINKARRGPGTLLVKRRARRSRALARVLSAVCFAATVSVSIAACGGSPTPSGTYKTTISNGREDPFLMNGTWYITFNKGGAVSISRGGGVALALGPGSHYRGTTLVVNPQPANACGPPPGTGSYHLDLKGNRLTVVRRKDPCKIRSFILTHTFTKTKPPLEINYSKLKERLEKLHFPPSATSRLRPPATTPPPGSSSGTGTSTSSTPSGTTTTH
jgi:hypothetical protein